MEKSFKRANHAIMITPYFFMIVISCVCALVYLAALPYKVTLLVELANRTLLALWIVGGGYVLLRRLVRSIPKVVASTVVLTVFTLFALLFAIVNNASNVFDKVMKVFGFLALPFMLCYSAFFRVDERAKRAVCIFAFLSSFVFLRLYFSDLRYYFEGPYAGVLIDDVTLGYPNPNQAAIYLFACAVVLFSGRHCFKSNVIKMLFALDGCVMVWIMIQTKCRTAILLMAVFGVLAFASKKRPISKKLTNIALLMPAIYAAAVVVLPMVLGDISFLGADLVNGRDEIYELYFQHLDIMMAVVGDMNTFPFENLHNGYVAIAASTGLVSCVSYVFCLRSCVDGNRPDADVPAYVRLSYIGFLCMIMYACSEAAFFMGGSFTGFLMFTPVILFAKPYASQRKV